MGDHEELAVLAQLLVDLQQPAEVGVVERGLDLVEDVERRRPGLEQRDQEGHRHQGALATGEQGEPLDLLAGWPGLHLDAGGEHVAGVGEDEPPLAAREQPREDVVEGRADVGPGLGEDLLDPLVDLRDDVEQVLAGPAEVLELLAEELVPLLQGGELLERERVDPAERASARSAVRSRFVCSSRSNGTGSGASSFSSSLPSRLMTGTSWSGP